MTGQDEVLLRCRFSRGGFDHERKFLLDAPRGGRYTGIAFIEYCFDQHGHPLPTDEPPHGSVIPGLLAARVIQRLGAILTVSVPDGEICDVGVELLVERTGVLVES